MTRALKLAGQVDLAAAGDDKSLPTFRLDAYSGGETRIAGMGILVVSLDRVAASTALPIF